jgi:hypothetical protein
MIVSRNGKIQEFKIALTQDTRINYKLSTSENINNKQSLLLNMLLKKVIS